MKKIIISFIKAIFTYFAILVYFDYFLDNNSYNIFVTMLFFFLWWNYYKYGIKKDDFTKKEKILIITLSMIITLCLSIGNIEMYTLSHYATSKLRLVLFLFLMLTGFLILFIHLFSYIFVKTKKISFIEKHKELSFKHTLLIFIPILCSYMLYFIRFFPAIMTPDSYYVIHYANNFILSDFHTFGHTWFFGIPFHLGKIIFHNLNMAVAFSMIIQILCICLIITIVIKYFYEKNLNKKIVILLVVFYALNPLFAYYSVTLWRDVMFGTAFLLLIITIYEFITNDDIKKKYIIYFIISVLIILFFRNNGIYVFLFTIPFLIFGIKNHKKLMSILCGSLLVFYIIIKGPVFSYFNVERTTTVEAFSIPLQQIARVVVENNNISGEDRKFLEEMWDYEKVSTTYIPTTSDPIKNLTNKEVLNNNKLQFFKTYLHLLVKYPKIYVEAYIFETAGYWYPDIIYWAAGGESKGFFDTENVHTASLVPNWYKSVIDLADNRYFPFSNLIWSVGLMFLLLVTSTFNMLYRNKKYYLCYIPLYGLWLSIMVSTPVFCELRYVYGIFFCMPIIMILPFIINERK